MYEDKSYTGENAQLLTPISTDIRDDEVANVLSLKVFFNNINEYDWNY